VLLHDGDDAVHGKLLHTLDGGMQGAFPIASEGLHRDGVAIAVRRVGDAAEDTRVAIGEHVEQHDADILELAVLKRPGRIVGPVTQFGHGGFHTLPCFRPDGIASVGDS